MKMIIGITAMLSLAIFAAIVLAMAPTGVLTDNVTVVCNATSCPSGYTCDTNSSSGTYQQCIPKVCGVTIPNASISFGNAAQGGPAVFAGPVNVTNNGNANSNEDLSISGNVWSNGMPVGATGWSKDNVTYTSLTTSNALVVSGLAAHSGQNVYFSLLIPLSTPTGAATQNITFTGSC